MKLLLALLGVLILSSLATAGEETSTTSATVEISAPGNPWGILADASGPAKPRVPGASEAPPAVEAKVDSPAEPAKVEVVLSPTPVVDDVSGALAAAYDRIEELKNALEARDQQVSSLREELAGARLSDKETGNTAAQGREGLVEKISQLTADLAKATRDLEAGNQETVKLNLALQAKEAQIRRLQFQVDDAAKASGKDIEATGLELAAAQKRIVELSEALAASEAKVSEAKLSVWELQQLIQVKDEQLALAASSTEVTPMVTSDPTPEPTVAPANNSAEASILRRLEEGARKLKAAGH